MHKGGFAEKLMGGMLAASAAAIVHGLSLYMGFATNPGARRVAFLWMTSGSVVALLTGFGGAIWLLCHKRFPVRRAVEGQVFTRYTVRSDGTINFEIPELDAPGRRFVRLVAPNGQMHDFECSATLFLELDEGVTGSGEVVGDHLKSFRQDQPVNGSPTTRL